MGQQCKGGVINGFKTITGDAGLEIQNAYIHIDEYTCDKNEKISARIRAYVSRDLMKSDKSYISGSEDVISLQGNYSDTAVNTKKQIYVYIKTLDKYKNAVDVLE